MSIFSKLFPNPSVKIVKSVQPIVDKINSLEKDLLNLSLEDLKNKTLEFKERLAKGEMLDDLLPEAFAVVRETSKRVIGQRHFDAQLFGGIFLHRGYISEMRTGEGKTLTATLSVYLNALSGKGVHLVTVNDYLAKRDAVWMGRIYNALGLTVGCIQQQMISYVYEPGYQESEIKIDNSNLDNKSEEVSVGSLVKIEPSHLRPCQRRESYACDITYGTNNEYGFDYLRDNMATREELLSQRELNYAIIDEVDSILIDEARTPLIISAPAEEATEKYYQFAKLVSELKENEDYNIDEKMRSSTFTDAGIEKMEKMLNIDNIYAEGGVGTVHHLEQALKAMALFKNDRDYVVKNGEIIIVDEFTGRMMVGRRYSEGLHQAIEAKEGVKIQQESKTLATISLQNYFRLYEKLAGMTGTAATEADEFRKIYGLEVIVIPTNKPIKRIDRSDVVYKTETAKYRAIVTEIERAYHSGQPVLVGTKSIEQNEVIDRFLKHKKIPHQILNAKNHESEASIIAQAGRLKAVTVATNIAGRGVDIVLGGSKEGRSEDDWQKEHAAVLAAGGLHILGAVRHESRRIDNQLRGRSGRQGDPGSSVFYISLEDDIMRIFGGEQISRLMDFLKVPEDQPLEASMVNKAIETAQSKVESFHFDQRKNVVEYDDVMNKQREIFYTRRYRLLEATGSETGISPKIDQIIQSEVRSLTTLYSPDGISAEESDRIVKEFQTILPLDSVSSNELEKKLSNQNQEFAQETLSAIINQARQSQSKHFGPILKQIEIQVALTTYDEIWMEHLDTVDDLREGIGLRGYAQKDPLVEYKAEAFNLFESLLGRIDYQIARRIFRVQIAPADPVPFSNVQEIHQSSLDVSTDKEKSKGKAVGRNDPCPCGSGKKYKKCCYPKYG